MMESKKQVKVTRNKRREITFGERDYRRGFTVYDKREMRSKVEGKEIREDRIGNR